MKPSRYNYQQKEKKFKNIGYTFSWLGCLFNESAGRKACTFFVQDLDEMVLSARKS